MNSSDDSNEIEPINKKALLISRLTRAILYILIEAAILFGAAGRLDWIMAWIYLAGYSIYVIVSQLIAPLELEQPAGRRSIWDIILVFIYRLAHPVILVLAGLEFNSLQQQFPLGLVIHMIVSVFLLLTFALMLWAEKVNPYYDIHFPTEAVQEQDIVTTGPYQFIRHPGYLGLFMLALARSLVFGSLLGLAPGIIGAVVIILLTAVEDRALQNNLDGYKSYTQSVKYRLFEGIW